MSGYEGGGASSDPGLAPGRSREWTLDAETEYRFELDAGTSLAIKVMYFLYCGALLN